MLLIDETDKKIFGELLLIIGGFMFADILVRKFLEISSDILPWIILPLLSFLIIMSGVNLKENKESVRSFLSLSFLIIAIVLLIFSANSIINVWWFILFGGVFGIIIFIWTLVSWIKKARH